MHRKLRIAAIILAAVAAAVAVLIAGAYVAMQRVRPFYEQASQVDPQALAEASRVLESRAAALVSDAQKPGQWQAAFTAAQINGWIDKHVSSGRASALPDGVSAPRVALGDGTISLAFRTRHVGVDTVVSVDADVLMTEANEVAARLTSVRAGALPVPVMKVANSLAATCQELDLPVRWTHADGLPVALVDISSAADAKGRRVHLDAVELTDGTLLVAGHTEENDGASPVAAKENDDVRLMIDD